MSNNITPVLLLILDGFGYSELTESNAILAADTPNWDTFWQKYPHTLINASEQHVGLPNAQMGNSEVGHLNIGSGRVIYQELSRVDMAVQDGTLGDNPAIKTAIDQAIANDSTLHIMGLLSPGGVHSHESHIFAMFEAAANAGVKKIQVHAFLDGRDTPPKSAAASLEKLQQLCDRLGVGRIATLCGRYYAMDRDNRWERVKPAYDAVSHASAEHRAESAIAALEQAYNRGETDEFVQPTIIGSTEESTGMQDNDTAVFMNFRADRARELTRALTEQSFNEFERDHFPRLAHYVTLSNYGDDFAHLPCAFAPEKIENCLGEYLSSLGLHQLRIAETEKYAHVTYFLNGGREQPFDGEERILVPSPKVATYDLQPEMSAFEVTDKLEDAIKSKKFDTIICNYANGDMVGHSGNMDAAIKAVETLDQCIGRVVKAMQAIGGEVIITADHGNAEQMADPKTGQAHTSHTLNLVPFLYIGRAATLADQGALSDIAPSILNIMGLEQPSEMTGNNLIRLH